MSKKQLFILALLAIVLNACFGGGGGTKPGGNDTGDDNGNNFDEYLTIPDEFIAYYIGDVKDVHDRRKYFYTSISLHSGVPFVLINEKSVIDNKEISDDDIQNADPLIRQFLANSEKDDLPSFYRLGGNKAEPNGDPDLPNYKKIIEFHSRGGKAYFVLEEFILNADADDPTSYPHGSHGYEFVSIDKETGGLSITTSIDKILNRDYIRIAKLPGDGKQPPIELYVTTLEEKK